MKRRINRTGRVAILRRHSLVCIRDPETRGLPWFDLELDLSDYRFPDDAMVRVEAWRSNAIQRWDFGTVGNLRPPPEGDRVLTEVPVAARFRVMVVDGDGSGRLLGHAPNIQPARSIRSLLPVRESRALGDEVWRVDFGDGFDMPELLVNAEITGISQIVRGSDVFRTLVMPAALRAILSHLLLITAQDPQDPEGPWHDWFEFARTLLPDFEPPAPEAGGFDEDRLRQASDWISKVVEAFAQDRLRDAAETYSAAMSGRSR